jgi:hypothetical protein
MTIGKGLAGFIKYINGKRAGTKLKLGPKLFHSQKNGQI